MRSPAHLQDTVHEIIPLEAQSQGASTDLWFGKKSKQDSETGQVISSLLEKGLYSSLKLRSGELADEKKLPHFKI